MVIKDEDDVKELKWVHLWLLPIHMLPINYEKSDNIFLDELANFGCQFFVHR